MMDKPMRERMSACVYRLQEAIVSKLETYGSGQKFRRESWTRDEDGGGGLSCTFTSTSASHHPIEKAAVNVSNIHGVLPPAAVKHMSTAHAALKNIDHALPFVAAGLSVVLHSHHPRVPAVHANYRYFEVLDLDADPTVLAWWFGAIADMTPAYVDPSAFRHFHATLRSACDAWAPHAIYPDFKASCDDYLYIPHRCEHRGIGGIRFDDLDSDAMRALLTARDVPEEDIARLCDQASLFRLVASLGDCFLPSFIGVMERYMDDPIVSVEKRWQLLRRGRAVEFNLVIERGTKFGLAAPGINVENVLSSMPPEARWEYCTELGTDDQDTPESDMVKILKEPRCWVD